LNGAIGKRMYNELLDILKLSGDFIIQLNTKNIVVSVYGKNRFSDNIQITADLDFFLQLPPVLSPLFKEKFVSGNKLTFTLQLQDLASPIIFDAYFAPSKKGSFILIRESADKSNFEMAFQRSEAKFRMVLETAAQGILLVNIHGQITLVNTKIEQLFGCDRDELLDNSVDILLPLIYRDMHSLHRNNYLICINIVVIICDF
jgi:PAS domain-containing protein